MKQFYFSSWLRKWNTKRRINYHEVYDKSSNKTNSLVLKNITYGYVSHKPVIENVNLRIPKGSFVGLVGPSGSGKSTLIKIIAGLYRPWSGSIQYYGTESHEGRETDKKILDRYLLPPYKKYPTPQENNIKRMVIGYVPQIETVERNFPVTVKEVVSMGVWDESGISPFLSKQIYTEIDRTLDTLGIHSQEFGKRQIHDLSGGEQQRVFLARALIRKPNFLLLDEPTSGVDQNTQEKILKLLTSLSKAGLTIIITTHDLSGIARRLPWVVCVNRKIVAEGSPSETLTEANILKAYGLVENNNDDVNV